MNRTVPREMTLRCRRCRRPLKGILACSNEELVSIDFKGNRTRRSRHAVHERDEGYCLKILSGTTTRGYRPLRRLLRKLSRRVCSAGP